MLSGCSHGNDGVYVCELILYQHNLAPYFLLILCIYVHVFSVQNVKYQEFASFLFWEFASFYSKTTEAQTRQAKNNFLVLNFLILHYFLGFVFFGFAFFGFTFFGFIFFDFVFFGFVFLSFVFFCFTFFGFVFFLWFHVSCI